MKPLNVMLLGVASVIAYDSVASVGSLVLGFPYASAAIGSLVIYLVFGFFASRVKSWWFSIIVGLIVGLADATVGWGISWLLGPGRLPAGSFTALQLLLAAASIVAFASVCAGVGGVVGGFFRARAA